MVFIIIKVYVHLSLILPVILNKLGVYLIDRNVNKYTNRLSAFNLMKFADKLKLNFFIFT